MATWKKALFIIVLVTFIGLSVFFTFYSIARDTYEFKEQTSVGDDDMLNGWVFYGFSGNPTTKKVHIDYVRDEKGENPDETKPVCGIDDFTIVSDEYAEFIYIGKDVKYISEQAFFYCKKLKAVYVDENNPSFCSENGILYSKDKKTLLLHPIMNGEWQNEQGLTENADTFDIPQGVERINGYSFYKNTGLVHLTFPDTVKQIGDMAFFGCGAMWSIRLPESLQSIGNDAFSNCGSMCPVMYIPASVTDIGHHAFFSCSALSVFYMGAESADDINAGEAWLPKNIKKGIIKVAPKPEYSKTYEDAEAEKERLDKLNQEG